MDKGPNDTASPITSGGMTPHQVRATAIGGPVVAYVDRPVELRFDQHCPHHLVVFMIENVAMPDIAGTTGVAEGILGYIETGGRIKGKQVAAHLRDTGEDVRIFQ